MPGCKHQFKKVLYIYIYVYIYIMHSWGGDGGNTCAADEFTLSHILGSTLLQSKICATFCEKLYSVEFERIYSAC